MSAGSELAAKLVERLTKDELRLLVSDHGEEGFVDGFLCGKFGAEHSRVALYNASLSLQPHLRRTAARLEAQKQAG